MREYAHVYRSYNIYDKHISVRKVKVRVWRDTTGDQFVQTKKSLHYIVH